MKYSKILLALFFVMVLGVSGGSLAFAGDFAPSHWMTPPFLLTIIGGLINSP